MGTTTLVGDLLDRGAQSPTPATGMVTRRSTSRHGAATSSSSRSCFERGASPDMPNLARVTPLMSAAFDGHVAVMRLLLERGAATEPIDQVDKTAMVYAAGAGHRGLRGGAAGCGGGRQCAVPAPAHGPHVGRGVREPSHRRSASPARGRRGGARRSRQDARSTSRRMSTRATSFAG